MKGVTHRDLIKVPELGTTLKTYWILSEPGTGSEYLIREILRKNPEYFVQKEGIASIYGDEECMGNFLWIFDRTLQERLPSGEQIDVPLFNEFNYENGEHLPVGKVGNCGIEGRVFGLEQELLMEKYENDVPRWMKEFAVEISP